MGADFSDTLILKAGTSSSSNLPFTAHPQPTVTLTFNDGGEVRDTTRTQPVVEVNKAAFVIKNCERPDTGDYMLTLQNEYGQATLTIKVVVLGELPWNCSHK